MDDRQVAALAVGALLLLAGMFALGLLVGMQLARRSTQPALAGDLAALDEQRAHAQRNAAPTRSDEQVARPEARREVSPPPSTALQTGDATTSTASALVDSVVVK